MNGVDRMKGRLPRARRALLFIVRIKRWRWFGLRKPDSLNLRMFTEHQKEKSGINACGGFMISLIPATKDDEVWLREEHSIQPTK
jgi:hypothetical protein